MHSAFQQLVNWYLLAYMSNFRLSMSDNERGHMSDSSPGKVLLPSLWLLSNNNGDINDKNHV